MRFDLDEQQQAFQRAVTEYLAAECPPSRALHPHDTGEADLGIWQGLMGLGIGGIVVPEAYGGMGLGLLELAVVSEALGRFAAPGPFLDHALATLALVLAGSDEQKARWLSGLANGELRATVAFGERGGVWSPELWELTGESELSGAKQFVMHAQGADLVIVGLKGGRLALVEKSATGMTSKLIASTDAGRPLHQLDFSNTPCSMLPEAAAHRLIDAGSILLAADAFGGASHCVEMAVDYAKLRVQFDRPIGAFQAVKHQLADMAVMVAPTQGLYWYAAHAFDTEPAVASQAAALAKGHITELFPRVARRMIEAHGGIGYTWEFSAHVWLKRALFDQAYLGMPRQHRARLAQLCEW
ncbi:acyl-CoA dehydrogenase family protein [Paraburkholderia phytofirmans]|uniref:acyl-CoA dehydrogenase family protein n=1 Tax=Paraburkholderia phytofirmans TaxID=261302 RepID=UPI0038B9C87C